MNYLQRFIILLSVMVLAVMYHPAPIFGQSVGERLRVKIISGITITGIVRSTSENSFDLVLSGGGLRSVPFGDILVLERSSGVKNHMKTGFLIGAGTGTVLGVVSGLAWGSVGGSYGVTVALTGTIFWGGGLGLLGGLVGYFMEKEVWESIPIPSAVSSRLKVIPWVSWASVTGESRTMLGMRLQF